MLMCVCVCVCADPVFVVDIRFYLMLVVVECPMLSLLSVGSKEGVESELIGYFGFATGSKKG